MKLWETRGSDIRMLNYKQNQHNRMRNDVVFCYVDS